MRGASLPKSTHLPEEKKPLRQRLPGFLDRFLRRSVVRFVGAAARVIGNLLDIASNNGLDLTSVWPKELSQVKWLWYQESGARRDSVSSGSIPMTSSSIRYHVEPWGVQDFFLLMDSVSALKGHGTSPNLSPSASIIIPVFNNVHYTFECLRSLLRDVDLQSNEIIVVNNGSTDRTGELLELLGRVVRVLNNPTNEGFSTACNQGADLARGRYLVFLNNDTVVERGWLGNLVSTIETRETVGAVGSMLVYPDGRLQ